MMGMTAKRFKLSEPNGAYLIDDDKPLFHMENDDEVVELLNKLNDENEQLKKKLYEFNTDCEKHSFELEKENEQLKQTIINFIENGLNELFGDKYRIIEDIGDAE